MCEITIAHSPDPDDAFIFYGLTSGKIKTSFKVCHILNDIETLNRAVLKERYDVSAVSFHTYFLVKDKYKLMNCGASMGVGYGPIVVRKNDFTNRIQKIAVPGRFTTAFLLLKIFLKNLKPVFCRFDKIIDKVLSGEVDAGLLIHEGQINYKDYGLVKIFDMYNAWQKSVNKRIPLPLGAIVMKKSLPRKLSVELNKAIKKSILLSFKNFRESICYATNFSRGLDKKRTSRFVRMYVNKYSLNIGRTGRESVRILYDLAKKSGAFEGS